MNLTGPYGLLNGGHLMTHCLLVIVLGILYYRWFHNEEENFTPVKSEPMELAAPPPPPPTVPVPVLPPPAANVAPAPIPAVQAAENPIESLKQLYPPTA